VLRKLLKSLIALNIDNPHLDFNFFLVNHNYNLNQYAPTMILILVYYVKVTISRGLAINETLPIMHVFYFIPNYFLINVSKVVLSLRI